MAEYVYANRFETQLSADIDSTQTNIPVVSTAGAPSPPTNETWFVVFESADTTVWEIAEVTAQTATSLTVARGVDGSTAQAFLAGSKVENRTTAETLQNLLPRATAAALYGDMKSPALQALGELYSAAIADGTQTQSTGLVNTENSVLRYTPLGVPPAHAAGKLFFDSNEDSLVYYNIEPAMSVNIGREGLVRVINLSGATIPNGSAVYVTGANSDLLTVDLAIANSVATSNVLGLTTHDILNTGTGYVTVIGKVGEVNTSTFTAGDLLYLSPSVAGGLTNVRPGNYVTPIGVATIINATTGSVTLYPVYGVPEAPTDGQLYGRRGSDETWQLIPAVSADAVDGPGVPVVDNNFVLWDGTSGTLVSDDGVNVSDFTPASHAADGTIHFTESSIDHTAIQNIGVNTHPQIDTHIGTAGIHFTESSIDHTAIQNIGTNSHPQIDTHIGTANIHFADTTEAVTPQARLAGSWVNVPDTGGSGTVRNATDGTNTSTDKVTWRFVGTGDATATVTDGVAGEAIVTINAAGAVTSLPEAPADGQAYGRRGSDTSWQPVYLKTETYSQAEVDAAFGDVSSDASAANSIGQLSGFADNTGKLITNSDTTEPTTPQSRIQGQWVDTPVAPVGGLTLQYTWSTSTAGGAPPDGEVRVDNADYSLATLLRISALTRNAFDVQLILAEFRIGDFISVKDERNSNGAGWTITSVTNNTTWLEFGISFIPGTDTGQIGNGRDVLTLFAANPNSRIPEGGADNDVLTKVSSADYDMAWEPPAGGGNVSAVPTPTDNQVMVWASATTAEGTDNFTYDDETAMSVVGAVTLDTLRNTLNEPYTQVYASEDGSLFPVEVPAPGWRAFTEDTSGSQSASSGGVTPAWTEITTLAVTTNGDATPPEQVDVFISLFISNVTSISGDVEIGFGRGAGVEPVAGNFTQRFVGKGSSGRVDAITIQTDETIAVSDVISVWFRCAPGTDSGFALTCEGSVDSPQAAAVSKPAGQGTTGGGTQTTNHSWALYKPATGITYPGIIITKDPEETVTFISFTFQATPGAVYGFEFFRGTAAGVVTSVQPSQFTTNDGTVQEVQVSGNGLFNNQEFLLLQVESLAGEAESYLMVTAKFRRVRA